MTAATETCIGEVRICDAREYGHLAGFVIEQFSYWNQPEPSWAIPAWDERGYPDLAAAFPTIDAAAQALRLDGIGRFSVAA